MPLKRYLKKIVNGLKLIISILHPFKTYRDSAYSGTLYIIWRNGFKILESDNANYSFASLHRIMRFALGKTDIPKNLPILLLGLGGGSAVKLLRQDFKKNNHIIAVEIDPVIIDIAKTEFDVESYESVDIVCEDAYDFVGYQKKNTFGLVIIDIWLDDTVPEKFFDNVFWQHIIDTTARGGQIIFNMLIETTDTTKLEEVISILKKNNLTVDTYDKVDVTNRIVIAKK